MAAYRERKGRVDGRDAALVGEEDEIIKNVKTVSHFPHVCVLLSECPPRLWRAGNDRKQN